MKTFKAHPWSIIELANRIVMRNQEITHHLHGSVIAKANFVLNRGLGIEERLLQAKYNKLILHSRINYTDDELRFIKNLEQLLRIKRIYE